MILVAIAWVYVVLMVALVEATSERGTVLGALFTFALYGVLPLSIVMYLMLSPARRRARRAADAWVQQTDEARGSLNEPAAGSAPARSELAAAALDVTALDVTALVATAPEASAPHKPDQRSHAPGDTVAPKREEA